MAISFQKIKQIWKLVSSGKNFDRVLNKVSIVSASPGRCRCELTVEEEHTNGQGTLHGGFVTALVDASTGIALAFSNAGQVGNSVQLNISFIRSATIGEKVTLEAEIVKTGKSLAFAKADLFNANGDIIAQGNHTLYVGKGKTVFDFPQMKQFK